MMDTKYLPPAPNTRSLTKESEELQLRDFWIIVRRNIGVLLACVAVAAGLGVLYALRSAPTYQATTTIRIDEKKSDVPVLDALKEIETGSEISTEMQVLRSRTLAEAVVDSLGLRVFVRSPRRVARFQIFSAVHVLRAGSQRAFTLSRLDSARFRLTSDDDSTSRIVAIGEPFRAGEAVLTLAPSASEQRQIRFGLLPFNTVVRNVMAALDVNRPTRDANVVVVRFESNDPYIAREVPNVLARAFIERRQVVKSAQARSTVEFLKGQIDTLNHQLEQAEDSLQAFRQSQRVVSPADEATAQVQRLVALQAQRSAVAAERRALGALLDSVTKAAAHAKPSDPSPYRRLLAYPTLLSNQAVGMLLQALASVENERADLLIRRTPEDPDVLVLTGRVHDLEEQIRQTATTYLQGLGDQVTAMDNELSQFSQQLERVPATEVEYARLQRRPKVLDDIFSMLESRLKEAEIAAAIDDQSVRVIDAAIIPDRPIKPNKPLIVFVSTLLGLVVGAGVAYTRESMDRGVHTSEDVQRVTGGTVLALIPHIQSGSGAPRIASGGMFRRLSGAMRTSTGQTPPVVQRIGSAANTQFVGAGLITGIDPRSPVSEAYRALRTNITFIRAEDAPRMLVFTSPMPGDGKSTTTANFTVTLAQTGTRVLLIDADMRRGMLHAVFGFPRDRGLSDVMLGAPFSDCVRNVRIGDSVAFDFLSTGTLPPNPSELLGSRRMRELLDRLQADYDMIVIDSPPVNMVTDAAVLGTIADGVIIVARAGVTSDADLSYAVNQIGSVRASVLGVVLNDVDFRRDARYQGGYGYYQYHYYASGDSAGTRS